MREIKRLRLRYVGQEIRISEIPERTGRRVAILVNACNADAAHIAVDQGIEEYIRERTKWSRVPTTAMYGLTLRAHTALEMAGVKTVADVLGMTEGQLMELPNVTHGDILRIERELRRLGCTQ